MDIVIPSYALADQQKYKIGVKATNNQTTFVESKEINFIPISSRWVIVENSTAHSSYLNYMLPQSTQDITFNLTLKYKNNGCDSFYDSLIPNITYFISP